MNLIDKPIYEKIGNEIKTARIMKGYSLKYVGEKAGKSAVSIKRYEDAKSRIDAETLAKIRSLLEMDKEVTMTDEEIKSRIPYLKEQINQNERDFRFGAITCEKYWENNFYLMEEINNLIEQVRSNQFDVMMGNPLKTIAEWFK